MIPLGTYFVMEADTNECNDVYVQLTSALESESYADHINGLFFEGIEDDANCPKGCYMGLESGRYI